MKYSLKEPIGKKIKLGRIKGREIIANFKGVKSPQMPELF